MDGLGGLDATRVAKANLLYQLTLEVSQFCLEAGKFFSCENPSRSYLWLLPAWKTFLARQDVFQTSFHHCEYGGLRRKATLLVHNVPHFKGLQRFCSGNHVHLGWGKVGPSWATAEEAAYPWGLCKTMASFLKDQFISLGFIAPAADISGAFNQVQASRAFTGVQSRKRVPPLLSEFASVHTVTVPTQVADSFLRPGNKLPSDWRPGSATSCRPPLALFPAGSRVLRAHVLPKGWSECAQATESVVQSSPPSFGLGPGYGAGNQTANSADSKNSQPSALFGLGPKSGGGNQTANSPDSMASQPSARFGLGPEAGDGNQAANSSDSIVSQPSAPFGLGQARGQKRTLTEEAFAGAVSVAAGGLKSTSSEGAVGLDPADPRVRDAMKSGSAEQVAALMNQGQCICRRDLCVLLDLLPSEPLRWEGNSGAKSFQVGSFVHGPMTGVRSMTRQFPETTKAVCQYVRSLFPGFEFGTVGLFRDLSALPHRDSNNEIGTENALAALSSFEEGSLWMEDPDGVVELECKGVCVPVTAAGFRFDGKRLHATMPWVGRRDVVVAYMSRGARALDAEHAAFLMKLGFLLDRKKQPQPPGATGVTKAVIGVYRTPEQFVSDAVKVGHPTQLSSLLPAEIREAVRKIHRVGEANVAKERTATLRRWVGMAADHEAAEEEFKRSLPKFRKDVLESKRLLLFRSLLREVGHEDDELVADIARGFDLTGKLPRSNVFVRRFRPAEQTESQLRAGAKRLRDGLLATVKASDNPVVDAGVLKATQKELERGFIEGPIRPEDVPTNASLTHRFGVLQGVSEDGPKVRPIDNYLSSQVNAAVTQVEQVSVHTIDVVAGMLGCWLHEWFLAGRPSHSSPLWPKAALKVLAQHGRQRKWELHESTSVALGQLKHFLEEGRPRPVRARRDDYVHIYVDASFEPNGHGGLGGVIFSSSGFPLSWFEHKVDDQYITVLRTEGTRTKETVIFELEALVLSICLDVFRPFVDRKGVVVFTDNEGVFGCFVRGHSDDIMCIPLIEFFERCEESLETICWIDRVPSSSNPADDPSRGRGYKAPHQSFVSTEILAKALPQVFG